MGLSNREIIEAFFDTINRKHQVRGAFELYTSEDYIQHNPALANGREGAIAMIEGIVATPGFDAQVKRIIVEGDLAAVHMHVQFDGSVPDLAVMDIWRFEDGKIIEHWDVVQEVPATSANENSMF